MYTVLNLAMIVRLACVTILVYNYCNMQVCVQRSNSYKLCMCLLGIVRADSLVNSSEMRGKLPVYMYFIAFSFELDIQGIMHIPQTCNNYVL